MNSKGQASFELILLISFVLLLSVFIGSYFFQESGNSRVLGLAKAALMRELAGDSNFYYINSLEFDVGNNNIVVCLSPGLPSDANYIAGRVKKEAKISGVVSMFGKKGNTGPC